MQNTKSLYELFLSLCLVIKDFAFKPNNLKFLLLRKYCTMRMVSCWGKLINEGSLRNVINTALITISNFYNFGLAWCCCVSILLILWWLYPFSIKLLRFLSYYHFAVQYLRFFPFLSLLKLPGNSSQNWIRQLLKSLIRLLLEKLHRMKVSLCPWTPSGDAWLLCLC